MQELVSPEASEKLIAVFSLALLFIGAIGGWRAVGKRGLAAGAVGPLVWVLWQGHKYVTRYDPRSGYFGLESVAALLGEIAFFIALGWALGRAWNAITDKSTAEGAEAHRAKVVESTPE